MNKKKDPKSEYIIFRVTKQEKQDLREEATEDGIDISELIRAKIGVYKRNG